MSRNPPLLGDVLNDEEHVLGCMCDSFRSWARTKERKQLIQYQRSVPVNRLEWKNSIQYLKIKKIYPSIVVSNVWFPLVQIQSPQFKNFKFKMRKNSPLIANDIH